MGSFIDLTGQKFGMLTVMGRGDDYVSPSGKRRPRWICRCECGGIALCQSGTLKNGRTRSCGCLQKKQASERAKTGDNRRLDISGQRFGRLTAVKNLGSNHGRCNIWLCKCDCGNEVKIPTDSLRSGNTKSCGCLRDELISHVNAKHNKSKCNRLYNVWVGMRQRCNDKNHKSYANYGGRGISVCDEWSDYLKFEKWAVENGYNESAQYGECTIDRIDVNGNYEPNNCRWVDLLTQSLNKRNSRVHD